MRRRFISKTNKKSYLTIEALEDNLQVKFSRSLSYSVDEGITWKTLTSNTYSTPINCGECIMFKAKLIPNGSNGIGTFTVNKNFNLKGSVMSMIFGDVGNDSYSLNDKNYAFYNLFKNCTTLKSVSANFLPATTLTNYCYSGMFYGCTSLTTAPSLPATTLTNYCYYNMFYNCTSLTIAPELPATTLAYRCYDSMFYGCTSLTRAPELPATTLTNYCYSGMFYGCTSLTTAPSLPATTLTNYCYYNMFYNCTSLTIAPELPATTLAYRCYDSMFYGCTSLTTAPPELPATTLADSCYSNMFYGCTSLMTAPELPATTLKNYCYQQMFHNCTSLTRAPELPATTLVDFCYYEMFQGCTSLTTAPELPATTLVDFCYYRMFYGCSKINYIKMLATDISATICLIDWVYNVSTSGTFVKHPNMTTLPTGANGIPSGWTVVNDGEESGGGLEFPIYLNSGDNGELGVKVFEYITDLMIANQIMTVQLINTPIFIDGNQCLDFTTYAPFDKVKQNAIYNIGVFGQIIFSPNGYIQIIGGN